MRNIDSILTEDGERWRNAVDRAFDEHRGLASDRNLARKKMRFLAPALASMAAIALAAMLVVIQTIRTASSKHPAVANRNTLFDTAWTPSADGPSRITFQSEYVRIFDGCSDLVKPITVTEGEIDIGEPLFDAGGVCGGLPGGAGYDRYHLNQFIAGVVHWQIDNETLTLRTNDGDSLDLVIAGPALSAAGTEWQLVRVASANDTLSEDVSKESLHISSDGDFLASDLCGELSGRAQVSLRTIDFSHVTGTCSVDDPDSPTFVIDQLLTERVTYTLRGSELILLGPDESGQLAFRPVDAD